jgi:hypothetical protein
MNRGWVAAMLLCTTASTATGACDCKRTRRDAETPPIQVAPVVDAADEVVPEALDVAADGELEIADVALDQNGEGDGLEVADVAVESRGEVIIHRLVTCRSVRNRQPVGESKTFTRSRNSRFNAFIEAETSSPGSKTITVSLEAADDPTDATRPAKLSIASGRRYRTTTSFSAWRPAGRYHVVVRDEPGTVLARTPVQLVE